MYAHGSNNNNQYNKPVHYLCMVIALCSLFGILRDQLLVSLKSLSLSISLFSLYKQKVSNWKQKLGNDPTESFKNKKRGDWRLLRQEEKEEITSESE